MRQGCANIEDQGRSAIQGFESIALPLGVPVSNPVPSRVIFSGVQAALRDRPMLVRQRFPYPCRSARHTPAKTGAASYWAASYREDVNALAAFLKQRDAAAFARTSYHDAVCGPPGLAVAYFPTNFVYERDWSKADFFISFTKDHCDQSLHGRPIYRTQRLDTTLSVVLDLHPV
jgi:hypothetical protein